MNTRIDEIAERIYRISTHVPAIGPDGFTFNQFLLDADQPLLFHTGMRGLFPTVKAAVEKVMPASRLRWIGFGHVEADESGSMNQWLAAAPQAEVVHGRIACDVSLNDLADRPPRALDDGATLELGGMRVRLLATPHVPHAWESVLLFEESSGTLLCGDLFTAMGGGPPLSSEDPVGPALAAEAMFGATSLTPNTAKTIRRLASLGPKRLALMHGSSYEGDGGAALARLADAYEAMHADAISAARR